MSKPKKQAVDAVVETDDQPDIPPALSDHEWSQWRAHRLNPVTMMVEASAFPPPSTNLVKIIALANDQLHDEDPRKLRREHVKILREVIQKIDSDPVKVPSGQVGFTTDDVQPDIDRIDVLHELAEAIESYLSPEASA